MWAFALMFGLLFLAANPAKPKAGKTVKLLMGRTYRIKAQLVASTPPMTEAVLDGLRQGLEASGMRDVRTSLGPPPWWEYTQVTQVETTIELNTPVTLRFGAQSITFQFLWATEIGAPGV